jgi:hypothetical protein
MMFILQIASEYLYPWSNRRVRIVRLALQELCAFPE